MKIRKYEYVYAVRDRESGSLLNKQGYGNPFFVSKRQAELHLERCRFPYWKMGDEEDVELVKFKLIEEGDIND